MARWEGSKGYEVDIWHEVATRTSAKKASVAPKMGRITQDVLDELTAITRRESIKWKYSTGDYAESFDVMFLKRTEMYDRFIYTKKDVERLGAIEYGLKKRKDKETRRKTRRERRATNVDIADARISDKGQRGKFVFQKLMSNIKSRNIG